MRFSSYYKNLINQTYNNKVEQQCFEGGEWHRILLAQCYKVSAVFFFFFTSIAYLVTIINSNVNLNIAKMVKFKCPLTKEDEQLM